MTSSETPTKKKSKAKVQRKWGDEAPTEGDMASLDFSVDKITLGESEGVGSHDLQALVDRASMGTRSREGMYEVKDWEFSASKAAGEEGGDEGKTGVLGSIFARLTGSKVLSAADLKPVLEAMKQHLMRKNVAMDIADKVCEGVGEGLVGKKVGGFQSALPCVPLPFYHSVLILTRDTM